MSMQGTTLVAKPESDVIVDAYVDALLGMPAPPPPPPAEPTAPPAADTAETAEADAPPMEDSPTEASIETPEPATEPAQPPQPAAIEPSLAEMLIAEFEAEMALASPAPEPHPQPGPAPLPPPPPQPAPIQPPQQASSEPEEAEDTAAVAAPVGQRWLRASVGEDRYAVELLRVQEVVRLAPMIAVRGAAPSLLGVMNLRGRVVPVHDLGRWLRRAPVQVDERSRIVVLEYKDELVGLLVTAVTDVVTLEAPQIEPPTPGLRNRIGMGIARTPGAPPTVLLDARVVFD